MVYYTLQWKPYVFSTKSRPKNLRVGTIKTQSINHPAKSQLCSNGQVISNHRISPPSKRKNVLIKSENLVKIFQSWHSSPSELWVGLVTSRTRTCTTSSACEHPSIVQKKNHHPDFRKIVQNPSPESNCRFPFGEPSLDRAYNNITHI